MCSQPVRGKIHKMGMAIYIIKTIGYGWFYFGTNHLKF
jgi:hypothetical protein